ncbi:MAG: PilZ domain-containing protein [Elusimicrobia bacterium]|nr:PilZ domain-containing protein [Elusimicrobiota bacterium]
MKFLDFITRFRRYPEPSKSESSAQERRRSPRLRPPNLLDVYFWADTDVRYGDGQLEDISTLGVLFASEHEVLAGTLIKLKIHFPYAFRLKESLKMQARVMRCSKLKSQKRYRIACELDPLDEESSAKLKDFMGWIKDNP